MCGINGYITYKKTNNINHKINLMNNCIIHRGPDDEGYFIDRNFGMSFRRLSIIDLKTGAQPMKTKDNRYCILFNGEIYNYKDIRNILALKGYKFKTQSDTEVILSGYHFFGVKIFVFTPGCVTKIFDSDKPCSTKVFF